MTSSFPLQANVLLQGLVKMPDLNGKKGVVKGPLKDGRHQVYVEDKSKTFALKVANLKYKGRSASSLSIKELKAVLKSKNVSDADLTGVDKLDLESKVSDLGLSDENIAEVLAVAYAPPPRAAKAAAQKVDPTQAANQLENMSPDQLRQQAMAMKSMDPNTLRRMNPQFANMTDAQLRMAADQMLMMANNPDMLKQASSQIKNMSPEEVQRMQNQVANNGVPPSGPQSSKKKGKASKGKNGQSMHAQYQEAPNNAANMSPEQLRQLAAMMKSMEPDTLRQMNPQLAQMSDEQIRMAASQYEAMAANPDMFKMAMDQMKNFSPEEMENMQKGMPAGGTAGGADGANQPHVAAEMSAAMLKNMDKDQLRSILKMVTENPDMLKQFAGISGMNEDKLKEYIDQFSQMDDAKLDSAVYMMQKAATAKDLWTRTDEKTGGNLLKILIACALLFTFLFLKWLFGGSSVAEPKILSEAFNMEAIPPEIEPESEF
ncbi:MAG: hypothetical protein SGBAC_011097 [Bacillariaceae sp.]